MRRCAVGPLVAGAAPAAASTPMNESYAVYATGRISTQPVGQASYSGGSPVILPNADAAGLLGTGLITDAAGRASASSRIPGLAVTLPGQAVLRAQLASSSCRFDTRARAASGASRITRAGSPRPGTARSRCRPARPRTPGSSSLMSP